uniref:Ovule protein n=1 Tax=Haemonchus placei TaxID=6290 RepID=A0A0N4WN35_HAEPC
LFEAEGCLVLMEKHPNLHFVRFHFVLAHFRLGSSHQLYPRKYCTAILDFDLIRTIPRTFPLWAESD